MSKWCRAFLEEAVKISSIYESGQEVEDDFWTAEHNIHASISVNNTLHNKCMNLLFLPEKYHISILDGGVDTCVLGKGWEVLSIHNSRRANVVGFDHEATIKEIFQLLVLLLHLTYQMDHLLY